jgi:hypothetical protein
MQNKKPSVTYVLKGNVGRNNPSAFTIPNTPQFNSCDEAVEFYNRNKDYDSPYNWSKFNKVGIYRVTISEEVCKFV